MASLHTGYDAASDDSADYPANSKCLALTAIAEPARRKSSWCIGHHQAHHASLPLRLQCALRLASHPMQLQAPRPHTANHHQTHLAHQSPPVELEAKLTFRTAALPTFPTANYGLHLQPHQPSVGKLRGGEVVPLPTDITLNS